MVQPTNLPPDAFSPFVPTGDEPFDHAKWCHLLRRAAMGVSAERLKTFGGKNPTQIVDALMSYDALDDRPYEQMLRGLSGSLSVIHSPEEAQRWWIFRMLDTPRPLQERMALYWHNHF